MLGPWYGWKLPWHCLHVPDGYDHHPWVPASYLEYHVGFFQGTISQTMICSECTGVPYAWCASYLAAWGWCAEKFGTQNLVAYVSLGFAATPLPGCGLVPYIWMDNGPFTKSSCATLYILYYINVYVCASCFKKFDPGRVTQPAGTALTPSWGTRATPSWRQGTCCAREWNWYFGFALLAPFDLWLSSLKEAHFQITPGCKRSSHVLLLPGRLLFWNKFWHLKFVSHFLTGYTYMVHICLESGLLWIVLDGCI